MHNRTCKISLDKKTMKIFEDIWNWEWGSLRGFWLYFSILNQKILFDNVCSKLEKFKKTKKCCVVSTGLNHSVRDHFKLVVEVCRTIRAMWIPAFQHILCSRLRLVCTFLFQLFFSFFFVHFISFFYVFFYFSLIFIFWGFFFSFSLYVFSDYCLIYGFCS